MKLNVAIAGYGNLGKSLEKQILADDELNLRAVISRRNIANERLVGYKNLQTLAGKVDVVLLALGSYRDLAETAHHFASFHTVDSFDTHGEIENHKNLLNGVKPNKISVCAVGWDPGLLSIARGTFSVAGGKVATFWGEGISQGHSNALRSIKGVLDAVEITLPNAKAQQAMLDGNEVAENLRHTRLCYVACVQEDKQRVEQEIRNLPHYFLGQQVKIVFCSVAEVRERKLCTKHSGQVIGMGKGFCAQTKITLESNTDFTAKIMLAYAKAVPQLEKDGYRGALDPFDIPLKYVANKNLV